jgi:hypothetical protein
MVEPLAERFTRCGTCHQDTHQARSPEDDTRLAHEIRQTWHCLTCGATIVCLGPTRAMRERRGPDSEHG